MNAQSEAISLALAKHGATFVSCKPLHGGACQENFKVELILNGQPLTLALRADAETSLPGSICRRDEFEIINAAVAVGVQTPAARWLSLDLLRPGKDAYFLEWCPGEAIGRKVVRNSELAQARARLPQQLAQSLARIHQIEPTLAKLPLEKPQQGPARAALAKLRAMLSSLPGSYPAVEYGIAWLSQRFPENERCVLVHGDYRTGNFLVTPDGLSAILDWEFSHFGSPYEDLAWISVRDWRFGRLELPIGGFAPRAEFYQAYEKASGHSVDPAQVLWWEIYGNLGWAVGSVFQGERFLSGAQKDIELVAIARRNVEMEFEALRLMKRNAL